MAQQLADRHVVITGAAAGIGRATACAARDAGARVTSLDLADPGLDGVTHRHCDVAEPEHWSALARSLDPPRHLLLNAGIMSAPPESPDSAHAFENVSLEAYLRIMAVNVHGVAWALAACLPRMPSGSSVVVMSSLAGVYGYPQDPVYAMTKHAVVGLVRSLAPTLTDRGIRLNALCPNRVDTTLLPREQRHRDCLRPEAVARAALELFDIHDSGGVWGLWSDAEGLRHLTTSPARENLAARARRRLGRMLRASARRARASAPP